MIRENSMEARALEDMIDKHGLRSVLITCGVIAFLKSAHIEENWQDRALAKKWFKAGDAINNFVDTRAITSVPE